MRSGKVEIPPEVIDVLSVQMSEGDVKHDESWYDGLGQFGGQDKEKNVRNHDCDGLVDPLLPDGELEEECSEEEGEDVSDLSVGETGHDDSEWVT